MADEQISFYSTEDVNNLKVPNGAIIISKTDEKKHWADLWAELDGNRYQIKPSYSWTEIQGAPTNIEKLVEEHIKDGINKVLLNYFWIEYTPEEENKEAELKIFANEGNDNMPVSSNGDFVTLNEIQNGVENGTFLVGDRPISIYGLKSAAYTESDEYTPMPVSIWSNLSATDAESNEYTPMSASVWSDL